MSLNRIAIVAACAALVVAPAVAKSQDATGTVRYTTAAGIHMQGFNFGSNGDVESARLLLVPFTFQSRINDHIALDGYTAYASGAVGANGKTYTLSGPVDTWLRLRWAANNWAVFALGLALPTGVESHSAEEAVVSNILANDLLGFREASWGSSASATAGVSTASTIGSSRVTMGASYRMAGSFRPSTDTTLSYKPGSEARVRFGLERQMSGGTFQSGLTVQQFSVDKADNRNLFQSGARVRGDLSYSRQKWGLYVANLWRNRGDLNIPIINGLDGSFLRDTTLVVGWQNLFIAGVNRSWNYRDKIMLVPSVDIKVRSREEEGGRGTLGSFSLAAPFRRGTVEMFPNFKISHGQIATTTPGVHEKVWGGEVGMVIRRAVRR